MRKHSSASFWGLLYTYVYIYIHTYINIIYIYIISMNTSYCIFMTYAECMSQATQCILYPSKSQGSAFFFRVYQDPKIRQVEYWNTMGFGDPPWLFRNPGINIFHGISTRVAFFFDPSGYWARCAAGLWVSWWNRWGVFVYCGPTRSCTSW